MKCLFKTFVYTTYVVPISYRSLGWVGDINVASNLRKTMGDFIDDNTFEFVPTETYPIQFGHTSFCECCKYGGYNTYLIFKLKLNNNEIRLNERKVGFNNMKIDLAYFVDYLMSMNINVTKMKLQDLINVFEQIKFHSFVDYVDNDKFTATNKLFHITSNFFDYPDIDILHKVGFEMPKPDYSRKENYNFGLPITTVSKLLNDFGELKFEL